MLCQHFYHGSSSSPPCSSIKITGSFQHFHPLYLKFPTNVFFSYRQNFVNSNECNAVITSLLPHHLGICMKKSTTLSSNSLFRCTTGPKLPFQFCNKSAHKMSFIIELDRAWRTQNYLLNRARTMSITIGGIEKQCNQRYYE